MNRQQQTHNGFTLLEMIVVIAIIGILALIVLQALSDARMKARNARRVTEVKHYITAIELAYDKYGNYANDGIANKHVCLGTYDDNLCWDAVISNQHGVAAVTQIQEFIPGFPPVEKVDGYGLLYRHCKRGRRASSEITRRERLAHRIPDRLLCGTAG